jgi:CRISPR-associated protein Cmr3
MHSLLIRPTDVLFFRDGRPMGGASSGHGASWPLPHILDAAFHGALHRANLQGVHGHNHRVGAEHRGTDVRKFGSLVSAGPFPVCTEGAAHTWFFPSPLDGGVSGEHASAVLHPILSENSRKSSSLPKPLRYATGSTVPPSKESTSRWWSEGAWNAYLDTPARSPLAARAFFKQDADFSDTEHTYGIGINPDTNSTLDGQFYSANYLRMREGWSLGTFAEALDKDFRDPEHGNDLLGAALTRSSRTLILGGQQRTASCEFAPQSDSRLPLPAGKRDSFPEHRGKYLVKWVLLTPALWPVIGNHQGGWLPSWISHTDGSVMLKQGDQERSHKEPRDLWRKRVQELPLIAAKLVAAVVGKSIPVTGFALAHEAAERSEGGAKSTHFAAPAGCVYYFEADSQEAATHLADALNWHGRNLSYNTIRRRRSNLMGEKGFGLGVCGAWHPHPSSL